MQKQEDRKQGLEVLAKLLGFQQMGQILELVTENLFQHLVGNCFES